MTTSAIPMTPRRFLVSVLHLLGLSAAIFFFTFTLTAAESAKKSFTIAAGDASKSLEVFSEQAGVQIVYLVDEVRGVTTHMVTGEMTAREALELMVAGTRLKVVEDHQNGTFTIRREELPVPIVKSVAEQGDPTASRDDESPVQMTPFEVSDKKDFGYRKTMTTTTSRVAIPIVDNPQAVEIISGELLKDFGANLDTQVFRYTASVTSGETEVGQAGIFRLRGFALPRYYNGLGIASAASLVAFLPTDNVERIEIAKGPVGLFFGNSTPNGVANYITKKPEFREATSLDLTEGSYRFSKVLVDTQSVINKSLAYRIIASYTDSRARTDVVHLTESLFDPSVIYRPNDKVEVSAELMYVNQHAVGAYNGNDWNWAVNPQYYKDVTSPDPAFVNFIQNYYGLANTAAALSLMNTRWGFPALGTNLNTTTQGTNQGTYLTNWSIDRWNYTGVQPPYMTGSTIDFWRYTPDGNKGALTIPPTSQNGPSIMADVSTTITPIDNLAIKYHWLRQDTDTGFVRQLFTPDAGLRPDGRIIAASESTTEGLSNVRHGMSDAQQLDVSYTLEAFNIKHNLIAGAEFDRAFFQQDNATFNINQAASIVDTYTLPGNVLTGQAAAFYRDPFSNQGPLDTVYSLASGAPKLTAPTITNFHAYYFSYRGSAFDDKLNVVLGIRHNVLVNTNRKDNTPTYGAIYEVVPGVHVFASASRSIQFTNQLSLSGPGMTPAETASAHLLENEHDKGSEIGIKTDWKDNTISGTISWYRDDRAGIVTPDFLTYYADPRNSGPNFVNTQVNYYVNGGAVRNEGLDFDLSWTPNRNFQVLTNFVWEYTSHYLSDPSLNPNTPGAWLNMRELHTRLGKSPLYKGNIVAKYRFGEGAFRNLSVGAAVRYSDTYFVTDSGQIQIMVPTETLLDLFANYTTKVGRIPTTYGITCLNVGNTINDITRGNGFETRFNVDFKF